MQDPSTVERYAVITEGFYLLEYIQPETWHWKTADSEQNAPKIAFALVTMCVPEWMKLATPEDDTLTVHEE